MGATSYRERHALQLHQQFNADSERDPFDQDVDPTEAPRQVPNVWHPSFSADPSNHAARLAGGVFTKSVGQQYLEQLKQPKPSPKDDEARRQLQFLRCWHDTSKSVRFLIVRAAGLPGEVVDKNDRDLTEAEKSKIRIAAQRLRDLADSLTKI